MRLLVPDLPDTDPTPRSILIWWDGNIRLWVMEVMDREGNGVEAVQYDPHKSVLVGLAKRDYPDLPRAVGTRDYSPEPLTFPAEETETMTETTDQKIATLVEELGAKGRELRELLKQDIRELAQDHGRRWAEDFRAELDKDAQQQPYYIEQALAETERAVLAIAASNAGSRSGGVSIDNAIEQLYRNTALDALQRGNLRMSVAEGFKAARAEGRA
jgi:hypothetical protein